ncbi:hypothetical protein BDR04DRAFT_750213 [Suillus decipiens]|nr:hypothetical protein BDR04DRAFT_750213 [Suillus decipiens]
MHFAALVALVVIASTVPSLASPAPIPHPQVTTDREYTPVIYEPVSVILSLLPAEVVQDTTKRQLDWDYRVPDDISSSKTKRQASSVNEDFIILDTSSSNTKRQASSINEDSIILDTSNSNAKRQIDEGHLGSGQDY